MAEENIKDKGAWMRYQKLLKKEGGKDDADTSKGLPFALNFDPSPAGEHIFYSHRTKKNQDKLGKDARKEGKSTKAAFGRMWMDGNVVVFKCDKSIPNMPRAAKLFFKSMKVKTKARVIDEDGISTEVSDEDEDEIQATEAPATETPEEASENARQATAKTPEETSENERQATAETEEETAETDAGDQTSAQRGRIGDIEKLVKKWFSKDNDIGNAVKEAQQMIDGNDAASADRMITEIEAKLDTIGDPSKIVEKAKTLQSQIKDSSDERAGKLTDAVRMAAKLMSNKTVSDLERASGMLDKISEAFGKMSDAAGADAGAEEPADDDARKQQLREELMTKVREIASKVEELKGKI